MSKTITSTKFIFDGIRGSVDSYGFVMWGGMGFQIEAAASDLRAAIDAALARARR